jgi:hypothetical protein
VLLSNAFELLVRLEKATVRSTVVKFAEDLFPGSLSYANCFWLARSEALARREEEKFGVRVEGKPVLQT